MSFVGNMSLYASRTGISSDREVIKPWTESIFFFLSEMPFQLLVSAGSRCLTFVAPYFEENPETGIGNGIFRTLGDEYVNNWLNLHCEFN